MSDSERPAKTLGLRIVRSGELDGNTPQTPGMTRAEAISYARVGAQKLWAGTVVVHPNAENRSTSHGELETVIYIVRGRARFRWGEQLEFVDEAGPGDFVYVPPFAPHQELNARKDQPVEAVIVRSGQEPVVVNLDIPSPEDEDGCDGIGSLPLERTMSEAARERIVAVIPARLASTRLPGKVLRPIAGVPMLGWVYRAALACPQLDQVLIATDSPEVVAFADSQGWPSVMTSTTLASGTDRVNAVANLVDADIYVNIQGDEPLLRPEHIESLLRPFARTDAEVTTLSTPCTTQEINDPNAVKVVTANDGRGALLFPGHDSVSEGTPLTPRKHIGIYAYRKAALRRFAELPPSPLESVERLEQLRLLEEGISIHVMHTPFDTIGVDTEEDLLAVERILRERAG